jgi:predicted deacetylase
VSEMAGSYLLRFDDICPTMNWRMWTSVERWLEETGVRPILAVIPDNKDEKLRIDPPHPSFWARVREWQSRGWAVALHGYQHRYVSRHSGMFGWNARSEFAGLALEEQTEKLQRAVAIFEREGVRPEAWVAPNHSFDVNTVAALRELGISVISDGLGLYPYRDRDGTLWVPMQLWRFVDRPIGLWTVCLHHNLWGRDDADMFRANLARFAGRFTALPDVVDTYGDRRRSPFDTAFHMQRRVRKALAPSRRGGNAAGPRPEPVWREEVS